MSIYQFISRPKPWYPSKRPPSSVTSSQDMQHTASLTDINLSALLTLATTNVQPDVDRLVSGHQMQKSHSHLWYKFCVVRIVTYAFYLVMAALCNRAVHYIFALWFFFFLFFLT